MTFGLSSSDREESGGESRSSHNRPDCAYFLLLGLCGAAFLLTIGGILTYIAFNPGSVDSRPHSPLSHLPHFHHHRKHHDLTEGHYFGHFHPNYHHDELKQQQQQHNSVHHAQPHPHPNVHSTTPTPPGGKTTESSTLDAKTTPNPLSTPKPITATIAKNETSGSAAGGVEPTESTTNLPGENWTTPETHLKTAHLNGKNEEKNSSPSSSATTTTPIPNHRNGSSNEQQESGKNGHHNYNNNNKTNASHHHHPLLDSTPSHHSNNNNVHKQQQQLQHPHPGLISSVTHHHEGYNGTGYEYQAKQSLALAIIGPLCLLMGIIVTLIVGVFALRYDCDHEPEPNIAFLRLRSEMSLNFDPSKNNYELLMPASSSTSAGVGSTHSIHPGGMPRC